MKFNTIFLASIFAIVSNVSAMDQGQAPYQGQDPYQLHVPGEIDDVEMGLPEGQAAPMVHILPNQFVYHTPVNQMIQPAQNPPHIHAPVVVPMVHQNQENQNPQ